MYQVLLAEQEQGVQTALDPQDIKAVSTLIKGQAGTKTRCL